MFSFQVATEGTWMMGLLFLNLLVISESGPGVLRGPGVDRQPAAQVPGHQPGYARPQRPAVLLHPLCFPAAQQRPQLALPRYPVANVDGPFFFFFFIWYLLLPVFYLILPHSTSLTVTGCYYHSCLPPFFSLFL